MLANSKTSSILVSDDAKRFKYGSVGENLYQALGCDWIFGMDFETRIEFGFVSLVILGSSPLKRLPIVSLCLKLHCTAAAANILDTIPLYDILRYFSLNRTCGKAFFAKQKCTHM
jgi:hypothetical protein